jgi:hypothetical protein
LRESISEVETKLRPHGFVRIHRSVLVNRACVEEILTLPTGEYTLHMRGGKRYPVTRKYKKNQDTCGILDRYGCTTQRRITKLTGRFRDRVPSF